MFGFHTYDPNQMVYQHIADWARQVRGHIAALGEGRLPPEEVERWQERFARLEQEAGAMLSPWRGQGGGGTPAADLMQGAYEALGGFVRALAETRENEAREVEAREGRAPVRPVAPVPPGGHRLPPLPYPYDALEPYIDEETMRLHHDRHHQSYVDGLNRAERMMAEARRTGDFALIKHWEREAAFHGAGHYLHTLFWESMAPDAGGEPGPELAAQMEQDFGGFERFREQFSQAAEDVEGGGWAIWVWSPRANRTEILTAEKHQNLSQWDVIPLLPLDVWEHAYYLKYRNDRPSYVENWWNVVNWPAVAERFRRARTLRWEPT